jgi:hypothetical protein
MRPVETVPGMGRRGIRENDGGGKFNYDIWYTWYIVRTFINATMYPYPTQW